MERKKIGVIGIIYDKSCAKIIGKLAEIQHNYKNGIISSMRNIFMTFKYCIEVIIVNGGVNNIIKLTESMIKFKGIEHVKLSITANTELLDLD